jgi:hypothetical protein
MKKRRAVSNIIGSLVILAIVASVGSVILFQGLNQINAFNHDLELHEKERVNELREDIIFEHVRFDPTTQLPEGDDLHIFLANIGSVDSNIVSITVVKIDTQELIYFKEVPDASQSYIPIEDHTEIILLGPPDLGFNAQWWNTTNYGAAPLGTEPPPQYKITVETAKGNFFERVVQPWND